MCEKRWCTLWCKRGFHSPEVKIFIPSCHWSSKFFLVLMLRAALALPPATRGSWLAADATIYTRVALPIGFYRDMRRCRGQWQCLCCEGKGYRSRDDNSICISGKFGIVWHGYDGDLIGRLSKTAVRMASKPAIRLRNSSVSKMSYQAEQPLHHTKAYGPA
jgi:hypothetical protein